MTFSQRIGRGIQSDHGWDAGKPAGRTSNSNPIAGLEESLQDHDFRLHLVKKRGNYGKLFCVVLTESATTDRGYRLLQVRRDRPTSRTFRTSRTSRTSITSIHTSMHACRHTCRHADIQSYRYTDRQTQTHTHIYIVFIYRHSQPPTHTHTIMHTHTHRYNYMNRYVHAHSIHALQIRSCTRNCKSMPIPSSSTYFLNMYRHRYDIS